MGGTAATMQPNPFGFGKIILYSFPWLTEIVYIGLRLTQEQTPSFDNFISSKILTRYITP